MRRAQFNKKLSNFICLGLFLACFAARDSQAMDWPDLLRPWRAEICRSDFAEKFSSANYLDRIRRSEANIFAAAKAEGYELKHLRGLMAVETVSLAVRGGLDELVRDYSLLGSLRSRGEPAPNDAIRELRHVAMIAEKVCLKDVKQRKLSYQEREQETLVCKDYQMIAADPKGFVEIVNGHWMQMQSGLKQKQYRSRVASLRKDMIPANRQALPINQVQQGRVQEAIKKLFHEHFLEDCSFGNL